MSLAQRQHLILFSPAGVVADVSRIRRARARLAAQGWSVTLDRSALARSQRFAGDDAMRLAALARVAAQAPAVAMATRGGYGIARLLDTIDWDALAQSVAAGTRWIGYSDNTLLQLAALAHRAGGPSTGPRDRGAFWHGPMAAEDFGRPDGTDAVDDVTSGCFHEAMRGELEAIGFRTEAGFDGLACRGRLWGGNLTLVASLLGTPHWPRVRGGILFLEDVNEHPYRVERLLLQLHQAGVLAAQKAVLLGHFSGWTPSPLDRGYTLRTAVRHLRRVCPVPILTGLPLGHVPTMVSLPQGWQTQLVVDGRDALLLW